MELWIARDADGELFIHYDKPSKSGLGVTSYWQSKRHEQLSDDWFPEITWEDDEPTLFRHIPQVEISDYMANNFTTVDNVERLGEAMANPEKKQNDSIEPDHYYTNGKDLFEEWYERYYHSEDNYTGREVFVAIMKSVAERYARRYPDKNEEDLSKAIYTMERLKEYEELEREEE